MKSDFINIVWEPTNLRLSRIHDTICMITTMKMLFNLKRIFNFQTKEKVEKQEIIP